MELKHITLYHVVTKLREEFETSFGKTIHRHCVIVSIEDSSDTVGWGEAPVDDGPWYSYETIYTTLNVYRKFIIPILKKNRVIESPWIFNDIVKRVRGYRMAKAGIETALWDLYAKLQNKPLYKVIGGVKERVSSGVSIGIIGNMEKLLKSVEYYWGQGYQRIKIKIAPGWDIKPIKRIREVFKDIPLQVDANASYSLSNMNVFKELDKHDLLMIEQPLHYEDLYEHSILQKRLHTPICLDESIKSIYDTKAAIALQSCRVINIKPARVGGLSESKLVHDYSMKNNIPVWIGGMLETGIGRGFQVALATLPNVKYPSDISASSRYYEEDIIEPPWIVDSKGFIHVPNKPGIGVEVIEKRLIKYSKRIYSISLRD
ncbi:MAG: o-succinylbenzoate synthase [Desulfurococcales archaeon]|nr:o-succinylbenzoate synthase [Desulfurococcales archaeon]